MAGSVTVLLLNDPPDHIPIEVCVEPSGASTFTVADGLVTFVAVNATRWPAVPLKVSLTS